jgi:hypothetical protein
MAGLRRILRGRSEWKFDAKKAIGRTKWRDSAQKETNAFVAKAKKSVRIHGWKPTIRKRARVTPTIPMEEDTWAADTIQVTRTTMTTTQRTSMVSFHTA